VGIQPPVVRPSEVKDTDEARYMLVKEELANSLGIHI